VANRVSTQSIERRQQNVAALRVNLYNAGLKNPGCEYAYLGAMRAGADAVAAFEAARECALIQTPADLWDTQVQRRYQSPREYQQMLERQQLEIARLTGLANPYLHVMGRAA